ncbi:MAG TPA: GGDEF domain-containing protein, partial [Dissulfurispiraceae bacterium]
MMAYGEILGLLHLQFGPGRDGRAEGLRKSIEDHKQPLAMAVAENIAFSLANLKLHETLYMQSSHDSLTGLFNRRHMEETLEREMHRMGRKGRPLGIIMLDLDHFKQFNDTFGHQAGDTLLRELGSFLQRYIREEDFACRYGGEEFVIILPETSPDITMQRAEKLRSDVRHLYVTHKGQELGPVTLSLGVAGFPLHGLTAETVLRAADSALYRAKAEGRDRVIAAQAIH